ncbi:MAG: hypothetical protein ACKVP7_06210 [Hyphomicrobiaceae bacterium]
MHSHNDRSIAEMLRDRLLAENAFIEFAMQQFQKLAQLSGEPSLEMRFDPNQPRDDRGRWTSGGGHSGVPTYRVERDTSGETPWSSVVSTFADDGRVAGQTIFNRDGSEIRSEFNLGDDASSWDERHTVVLPSGRTFTIENDGPAQTIIDDSDGTVVGRTAWTKDGPVEDPVIEQVRRGPRTDPGTADQLQRARDAVITLFGWLSTQSGSANPADGSGGKAVLVFKADEYAPDGAPEPSIIHVRKLDRSETEAFCPRLPDVQQRTDAAAAAVKARGDFRDAADYGTKVHTDLANQIRALGDPNYRAEISFLKGAEERYGAKGSFRIDVLENVGNGTVCVYDIKTGRRGLSEARATGIASAVQRHYLGTTRIVVVETRPTQ